MRVARGERSRCGSRASWISMRRRGLVGAGVLGVAVAMLAVAVGTGSSKAPPYRIDPAIHKIRHVVVIMQENRSFDSYFGTFPGANGIPMRSGVPTVCVPDPARGGCQRPFHSSEDVNGGGPHGNTSAIADVDGGKMDGFVAEAEKAKKGCVDQTNPNCANGAVDV